MLISNRMTHMSPDEDAQMDKPLWTPSPVRIAATRMDAFRRQVCQREGLDLPDYPALHAWSVDRREAFWQGLLGEQSPGFREVGDFDPADWFDNPKEARRTDRFAQFALAAASMALDEAGDLGADPSRLGVHIGTGVGVGDGVGVGVGVGVGDGVGVGVGVGVAAGSRFVSSRVWCFHRYSRIVSPDSWTLRATSRPR